MQELLKYNKQHWLRVRRFHVTRRHRRLNQFRHRLATLIPDPSHEEESPSSDQPSEEEVEKHPKQRRVEGGEEDLAGFQQHQARKIDDSDMQASEEARHAYYRRHVQLPPRQKQLASLQADAEALIE